MIQIITIKQVMMGTKMASLTSFKKNKRIIIKNIFNHSKNYKNIL
jgi:hypothetical protein